MDEAACCLAQEAVRRWEEPAATQARLHSGYSPGQHPGLSGEEVEWDCFSIAIVYLTKMTFTTTPRPFAIGPHQDTVQRCWSEIKSISRLMSLRSKMAVEDEDTEDEYYTFKVVSF